MSLKKICICLILIFCIIGAASAAEDVSADVVDVADDSVAVDAVSDDVSDSLESVDDEAVVDESAPAQDDSDDVELEASVDDEPALDEVDDELSGQSNILSASEILLIFMLMLLQIKYFLMRICGKLIQMQMLYLGKLHQVQELN